MRFVSALFALMFSPRALLALTAIATGLPLALAQSTSEASNSAALASELKSLQQLGSVLYVAAHPDDENTQLITYLARGRGYRTAYLSLTRGDGGQNVLKADFGERLGVARTQELMAARRLDGGMQFFTRALDFGFSKDYEETLSVWDRQAVLSDVVRVIRQFRPDVIVTRFSPRPGGTHGHHTASAVLAVEAFRLAADPSAFPEQLDTLKPWQPKRVLWNFWRGGGTGDVLEIDVAGRDPVHGVTFSELAGKSRAQHKTQGFDSFAIASGSGPRMETFQLLAGDPAQRDLMDGVDTTWARLPGGFEIAAQLQEIEKAFDPAQPEKSVAALLAVRRAVSKLSSDAVPADKKDQLDRLIASCLGLRMYSTVQDAEALPGERVKLTHEAAAAAGTPVRWIAVRQGKDSASTAVDILLTPTLQARRTEIAIPASARLTEPYWLTQPVERGMFQVPDTSLIGKAENPPQFPVEFVFEVDGQTLALTTEPVLASVRDEPWVKTKTLSILAPVHLELDSVVELFAPSALRTLTVNVTGMRDGQEVTIGAEAPAGWKVSPPRKLTLGAKGEKTAVAFEITAPAKTGSGNLTLYADVGGRRYSAQRIEIDYPHIPVQLLQSTAAVRLVSMAVEKKGERVGYIPGAGDTVAESLRQIGYNVTDLKAAELTPETLSGFDAVVVGVRALNTRPDLKDKMQLLFDFAAGGGNLVMQYNNPGGLKVDTISPYPLKIVNERVTDENAPITMLAPEHPVLNHPNKISETDFEGWVQERGLYFPNQWSPEFTPILACNDKNEPMRQGALLVAKHGKGHFVYTGLSFFRQLPAGVPGAYRLFANVISLGK